MTKGHTTSATTNEPFHVGKMIQDELRRQERTVTWLSRKLHCDRRNVYDIFHRPYLDTGLLFRLSQILGIDFFAQLSALMQNNVPK